LVNIRDRHFVQRFHNAPRVGEGASSLKLSQSR